MSYRITNIEKWKDLWFSNLSPNAKLLFFYFVENCDNAGFFEVNKNFMLFYTGLDEKQLYDAGTELKKSYVKSTDGNKLWFKNFLKYQKKLPLNSANNMHKQIIFLIQENLADETKFKGNNLLNSFLPTDLQIVKNNRKKRLVSEEIEGEEIPTIKTQKFIKPSIKEIYDYMVEKEFEFAKNESELFFNFYESKGWKVGKNSMLIWKSSVATWMITYYKRNKISTPKISKLQVLQKSHEEMNKVDYNEKFKNTINEQFN